MADIAGTHHVHLAGPETTGKEEETSVHVEHLPNHDMLHRTADGTVYKTRRGFELIPTPSDDHNDPLNWPLYWKLMVLFCACCSSLMVAFCAAGIIPGFFDIVSRSADIVRLGVILME